MRISENELGQGSKKWLAWRREGIGGSEIYTLACYADVLAECLGRPELADVKPTGRAPAWLPNLRTLVRRKLGLEPEQPANFHMKRGHRLEPEARAAAEDHYGMAFMPFCVYPEKRPTCRVSLDGFNDEHGALLEIKAPYKPWPNIPDYLEYQTAYQAEALRQEAGDRRLVRSVTGITIRETGPRRTDAVEVRAWRPTLWQDHAFCQRLAELTTRFYEQFIAQQNEMPPAFSKRPA